MRSILTPQFQLLRLENTHRRILKSLFRLESHLDLNNFKHKNRVLDVEGIKRLSLAKLSYCYYYNMLPNDVIEVLRSKSLDSLRNSERLKTLKVNLVINIS